MSLDRPPQQGAALLAETARLAELPVPLIVRSWRDPEDFAAASSASHAAARVADRANIPPQVHSADRVENPSETEALMTRCALTEKPLIVKPDPNTADPASGRAARRGGATRSR